MDNKDKALIFEFFYLVLCAWTLYTNEVDKWKALPEFNTYMKRLLEIKSNLKIENENFEKMFLDLRTTADMSSNDNDFLVRYKDFILSFSK
jgi:hypothetical protein